MEEERILKTLKKYLTGSKKKESTVGIPVNFMRDTRNSAEKKSG